MESVAFHHYWLRMRGIEGTANLDEYSLAATAAKLARFTRPVADPGSVLSTHAYGLHVDSGLYAQYMRDYAEARGVVRLPGEIADVRLRGDDGFIEALELSGGERIEADLFVDCTGSRSVLLEQALKVGYEDWTDWLFCDRAVIASCDGLDPFPLTRAIAHDAGWRLRIPLQNGAGAALVYSSAHLSDDKAAAELLDGLDGEVVGAPRFVRFRSGRRKRLWCKNCVAIGGAAGFLDPLESTNLHLIQNGVSKLAGLLPDRDCMPGIAAEYDRLVGTGFERLRDLVVLHYKLGPLAKCALEGAGSDNFWRQCREMNVPDSLAHKMGLFEARGRVALTDEETFLEPSWISAFVGQETMPRRYDPLADMVDLEIVRESMRRMRMTIREAANTMPSHRAYLSRICSTTTAASAPAGARSTSGAHSNS
jgi:tryptophan halogenase